MICFNCGSRFSDSGIRECGVCGMKMPATCQGCGAPNPGHAAHCMACGKAFPEPSAPLSQTVDLTGAGQPGESRRHIAVLFADVSGFTALSETRDPESVRSLINDCFAAITRPVYELEGAIDKYIGDCVMVLFGTRIPHVDDARRAATCALRMQAAMAAFAQERLAAEGVMLRLSIGVHYGLVVTGSVGNYYDKDYTVMGDTVNLAQRLQSTAEAGTVLVSDAVRQEARDRFVYRDMGALTVRNRKEPVRCWQLEAENDQFESHTGLLMERERPLASIAEAFSALMAGRFVLHGITGPSGIGKTALGRAYARHFERHGSEAVRVLRVDCTAEGRYRPHRLLSLLLHLMMNVEPEDGANARKYRMASYCYYLLPEIGDARLERMMGFLGVFMGLTCTVEFQEILDSMQPEDLEREMSEQLHLFLSASMRVRPTLLILDDLQWADDRSAILLNRTLKGLSGHQGAVLCLYRNDPRWMALMRGSDHLWELEPLSVEGTRRLACEWLGAEKLDPALSDALLQASKGNPLLVEAFCQAVQRHDAVRIAAGVASLHGDGEGIVSRGLGNILLAGMQELPSKTLSVLQIVAVVGTPFPVGWLTELAAVSDPAQVLEPAWQSGVLVATPERPGKGPINREIRFMHEMAREVLYDSLLLAARQQLHLRVAEFLSRESGNGASTLSALVSRQFEAGGDRGRAARHALLAAERYQADVDVGSAAASWQRFLGLLGLQVPTGPEGPGLQVPTEPEGPGSQVPTGSEVSGLQVPTGSEMPVERRWGDKQEVQRLLGIGGPDMVRDALVHLAERERANGQSELALSYLRQGGLWSDSGRERISLCLSEADLLRETGKFEEAGQLLDLLADRVGADPLLEGRMLLCRCALLRMRSAPEALEAGKLAEKIFRKLKDWRRLADTLGQLAGIHFARGEGAQARRLLEQAMGHAERAHDLHAMARLAGNLGILQLSAGDMVAARNTFARAVELARKIANLNSLLSSQINLGILLMEQGKFDAAQGMLEDVAESSRRNGQKYQECLAWLNLGDLSVERDRYEESRERYERASQLAEALSLAVEQALCDVGQAHVCLNESYREDGGSDFQAVIDDSCLNSAVDGLTQALAVLREAGEEAGASDALRLLGAVRLRQAVALVGASEGVAVERLAEPERLVREAHRAAESAENGLRVVKALRLQGILAHLSGQRETAESLLRAALAEAERLESEYEAAKGAYRLAKCLESWGRSAEAATWMARAGEHAQRLDDCMWKRRILPDADEQGETRGAY